MSQWDDPYGSTAREFKHGPWAGMPSRHGWNNSPNHGHMAICEECGYKWGDTDFSYRAHPSRPAERHRICWNCWMIDNKPDESRRYWEVVDRANSPSAAKPKAETRGLKSLGGQ